MRHLMILAGCLLAILAIGAILVEKGEVVTLETRDGAEGWIGTRVWIVQVDGRAYLRGARRGPWVERLIEHPEVRLQRDGAVVDCRATPVRDGDTAAAVDRAIAGKYGRAERWVEAIFESADAIAVRLDPRCAAAEPSP